MADPLAPFLQNLGRTTMAVSIAAVLIGAVLGLLARGAENWLLRIIRKLRQPETAHTPNRPTGDSDAPHCPSCNSLMVLRRAKRGASVGQGFWGCHEYPVCKGTRPET